MIGGNSDTLSEKSYAKDCERDAFRILKSRVFKTIVKLAGPCVIAYLRVKKATLSM